MTNVIEIEILYKTINSIIKINKNLIIKSIYYNQTYHLD